MYAYEPYDQPLQRVTTAQCQENEQPKSIAVNSYTHLSNTRSNIPDLKTNNFSSYQQEQISKPQVKPKKCVNILRNRNIEKKVCFFADYRNGNTLEYHLDFIPILHRE